MEGRSGVDLDGEFVDGEGGAGESTLKCQGKIVSVVRYRISKGMNSGSSRDFCLSATQVEGQSVSKGRLTTPTQGCPMQCQRKYMVVRKKELELKLVNLWKEMWWSIYTTGQPCCLFCCLFCCSFYLHSWPSGFTACCGPPTARRSLSFRRVKEQ